MLQAKTLFVIGAGASVSFNFPLGPALAAQISQAASLHLDIHGLATPNTDMDAFQDLKRFEQSAPGVIGQTVTWREISAALDRLHNGMLLSKSIDSFIDQCRHDQVLAFVAKYFILRFIKDAETRSVLAENNPALAHRTWLETFAQMLVDGVPDGSAHLLSQNLKIICFNYDRNIEHYLRLAFARQYNISEDEALRIVSKFEIIHPYGSLGDLATVPYGAANKDLILMARNIKTFSEAAGPEVEGKIESAIEWAEKIVYLGLGFGSQNMELLKTKTDPYEFTTKEILCCAYRVPDQARSSIVRRLADSYFHQDIYLQKRIDAVKFENTLTAEDMLQRYWFNLVA